MSFPSIGPTTTRLVLVGDAPFGNEIATRRPFSAAGAQKLALTLHHYGLTFNSCYAMYVLDEPLTDFNESKFYTTVKKRGEENGWQYINGRYVCPKLAARRAEVLRELDALTPGYTVLLFGELALWAVTDVRHTITTCRGSIYPSTQLPSGRVVKTVCTYSPREVSARGDITEIFQRDIQRAVIEVTRGPEIPVPQWNFLLQASFDEYQRAIKELERRVHLEPTFLACDIETIRHEIACVGLAWSNRDALCLPLRTSREYWALDEEVALVQAFKRVVEHPNARIIGQNFLYDSQYLTVKWGVVPRLYDDTMDMQHVLFPGIPKALHFLASVYCDYYQYWKDELDDYKTAPRDDNLFFAYNCRDCCYTFESRTALAELLHNSGLEANYRKRMREMFWTILRTTLRGVRINFAYREKVAKDLIEAGRAREEFLNYVIGRPFNPRSAPQMKEFFYNEMGVKPEKSRITGQPSLGAEILVKMHENYPLLGPVADTIIEMRSIGTLLKTSIQAPIDPDGRVRTFFKMSGPETFRLASSENAFGRGMNMQNQTKGDRGKTRMPLPNTRIMFVPDTGYEMFDIDLAGADAQVVAWEANDDMLKDLFRKGIKVHAVNAKDLFGGDAGPDGKQEPYYTRTKMGVHLSNYGGKPPTMAKALGITVREAEAFQRRWFDIHPGIVDWHRRVESALQSTRTITNKFGFRKIFFGRIDKALPEALAWGPQSTVAIVTARAMDIMDAEFDMLRVYIQVHDSIVFGAPLQREPDLIDRVLERCRITIPYDDPLVIPFGVSSSPVSWGHCK